MAMMKSCLCDFKRRVTLLKVNGRRKFTLTPVCVRDIVGRRNKGWNGDPKCWIGAVEIVDAVDPLTLMFHVDGAQ